MIHSSINNYIISNNISKSNVDKKNELSETYYSILKNSSRSPLYTVDFTVEKSTFAILLKETTLDIQDKTDMIFLAFSPLLTNDTQSKTDENYKLDILTNFSTAYNQLVELATNQQSINKLASRLLSNIKRLTTPHLDHLSACGIVLNHDQKLSINLANATSALDNQEFWDLCLDDTSFFHSLHKRMHTLSLDPMKYIEKTMITYPNPFRHAPINPYMTSIYTGMLFNNFF